MSDELLIQKISEWLLDGGCTCMCCEPEDGINLECEEAADKPAIICDAARNDIQRLLAMIRR